MTATRDIELSLSEILPDYLTNRRVSVSCSCWWQILHIWSGSGAIEN